jgi:hypothetical protein
MTDLIARSAGLIAALDQPDQPGPSFRALDQALAEAPGHILFTILVQHPALRQSERYYTNKPKEYPVGGRKPLTDSPWMQRVIGGGEPYIGRTAEDIRDVFFDHALILSLGCESVLNLPVRWRGKTVATLNLLAEAGHYTEAHIPLVRVLGAIALPALLTIARTK